ncbi:maltose alpha-D-glucosyltransferase [Acidisoma cellulosilytica]|uniref:maltose alpha-D-glucosyltransferase n=2 Tax=Acidisoma cellulosilyticum TaxID=2802395 RepID=A0A964E5C9_9PROT|nr:maltose alpha-D-glucosyltransferase [Acidisoma cellulosilyticum]MCB8882374.1 maltose alpha-D-glucosyltransferase [Acidisoma cellulosilyticum]
MDDPLWYKDAVIYQLHLKSFFDADNDGVGDFKGLLQKLHYIAELGVTAIWILPFYPSPRRDDGYDIADYRSVHEDYGDLEDVKRFVDAAHALGLRVITELVINHTSDQHPWFQAARRAPPGSPERDFYVWSDTDTKYAGTRIIFVDTEKSNWTWDDTAQAYYWHRFYSHQPDLNFDNPAVMDEVLSVMRFWLDMGIDGLRLDAVPYLVEREGTINENLPETHVLLKRIRAEMDAHSPGKMLLAEANQWPEDAQVYFGDGDECHMSFHFPLMPRMYMAIAREDRFPVTDIMRQTPDIPDNCQWAIFLRNHDELTLEMVTDSERDYLWETYAHDRRARLNLGIRRRLAPLLERDRRRIELMNTLLLSMPGTPVIYYGDEIGMGDNIHLGDRDGVRTPMQWSYDRNGGFSRADPASLVLPAIMDPLYGFQALNVEAQESDRHSLLHWTRRMLAVRKSHPAFGRGTLRFLYPGNRKIFAYLREIPGENGETVLCVCNLSRTAQAVELDLSTMAGRVPVDIVGGSVFPPIGQLPYLLTLVPYGSFWFLLAQQAELPTWHTPAPEPLPEFATLVVRNGVSDIAIPASKRVLEGESLPAYVSKRRWFGAKDKRVDRLTLAYTVPLPGAADVLLAEIECESNGQTERYVLPLGISWEGEAAPALVQQLALARVRLFRRVGLLTDAFALDAFATGIVSHLIGQSRLSIPGGEIRFEPSSIAGTLALAETPEIRRLSAEQSNSSLVVGDEFVVKLIRHVSPGINPEGEMTRYLTEKGFTNTAPLVGEVLRIDADGTPNTLMIVQKFVRNQGDGWSWTQDYLTRAVAEIALVGPQDGAEQDLFGQYTTFAEALGRRLGELHAVLAEPSSDPDFAPEVVDAAMAEEWARSAIEQIDLAFALLDERADWPDAEAEGLARDVLARKDALIGLVRERAKRGIGSLRTRIHGDFHLGQVLVVQNDAYIIDFEGEPARPLHQRRMKSSGLRDLAGVLRSLDYAMATAAGAHSTNALPPQAAERHVILLEQFRLYAEEALLDAYRDALRAADNPWVRPEAEEALLDLFLIEKAAYEIRYEITNRPSWLSIPLRGLHDIAARLLIPEGVA